MYLKDSLKEGLAILGFDKETIKQVSRERSLEEIFLSTLFMNYLLVLIVYVVGVLIGGYSVNNNELNMPVFFGLLMVYPFVYNILVYFIYGLFGLTAEMLDEKKQVKPLLSVGFHTAMVYTIVMLVIGVLTVVNVGYGLFLLVLFILYFLYTMFSSISTIYGFSNAQSFINVFIPFILIGVILIIIYLVFPGLGDFITAALFA